MRSAREVLGFGVSRHIALLFGVIFFAACSGNCGDCSGCGGCGGGFEERPYPPELYDQTVITSGQIRVTPSGLDFLETNIGPLVDGALPDGLNFCLPAQSGGTAVCNDGNMCMSGEAGCDVSLTIDGATLEPRPPNTLDVSVTVGGLDESLPVTLDLGFLGDVTCDVTPHLTGDQNQPARISADVPIGFVVDQTSPTKDVRIDVGELVINTDELDFEISGGFGCSVGNFVSGIDFVRDLILDQVQAPLQDAIDGIVEEQLCRPCDMNGQCPAASACNTDTNICEYSNSECVPRPLGVEGRMLLGASLADFTEHPEAALDLMLKVADVATVNDGLTLGLRSGYQPDKVENCAPVDPTARPDFDPIPLTQSIVGNVKPNGQPFMFGIGYHKKAIQHALWSVWAGGATCLNVGSDFVSQLNSSAFLAFLPSLRGLIAGAADTQLKIVPQNAPDVILGDNTVMASGDSYTIVDPLMTIDWRDLDIHIYIWGTDRYVRVARLRADIIVPVAIVPDGMGQIVPVIGDLGAAIQNVRPLDSELASDDPQRLADLIPTLVGAALPSLAGNLVDPIEVPEFFGLRLDIAPEDITSVDNHEMIAIFANLAASTMPLVEAPHLALADARVDYSTVLPSGVPRPAVELDMLGFSASNPLAGDAEIEYAYRVDNGWWSLYHKGDSLRIEDPTLTMPGKHKIHVRARYAGIPNTTSEDIETEVWIDWDKPFIEDISPTAGKIRVVATDAAESAESLEYRFRLVGEGLNGTWTTWSNTNALTVAQTLPETYRVDVEVRDRAGNTTEKTLTLRRAALESDSTSVGAGGEPKAGCSATGDRVPPTGLLLFAFFAVGMTLRRRTRRSAFVRASVLATVLAFSGCSCDDDETNANSENACGTCPTGTYCGDNGECVPGCDSDDQCVEGERCEDHACVTDCEATCDASCGDDEFGTCSDDGTCTCTSYCEAGCGDDEYCCYSSNSCEALPDPCVDTVCEPGFEPAVQSPAEGTSASCDVKPGVCECVALPPLDFGMGGAYLDVHTNGSMTVVASYNMTYGDLMIGVEDGDSLAWTYAEGVPSEGAITGDLEGPRGGISTKGDDVGTYTSVVVDASDTIHVFYRDEENDNLKYGRGSYADGVVDLQSKVIDETPGSGFWTDALLGADGTIHLVWGADNIADDDGGFVSEIRYATFAASDAFDAVTLTPEVIAAGPSSNPCGEKCDSGTDCVPAEAACIADTGDCSADCGEDAICSGGACVATWDAGVKKRLPTIGQHLELSSTPDGMLLVFYDHSQQSVGWMRETDGTWTMPNWVGTPSGPFASGSVDGNDKLHLAYMNTQEKTLVYENVTDAVVETVIEGARDLPDSWLIAPIGQDVAMRVDTDGSVNLVFQDATLHTLHSATRAAAGGWTVSELLGRDPYTGGHGFYVTMWQAADSSLIANWTINQQVQPIETAPNLMR